MPAIETAGLMGETFITLLFKVLVFTTLIPVVGYSQALVKPISSKQVFDQFDKLYQVDARLVNGDFYQTPLMSEASGHPYFLDSDWKTGSVSLEGIVFDSLLLRYDISSNQLIMNTVNITNSYLQLVLKKDRIQYFTLDKNLFQPFPVDDPVTGLRFCQILAEGQIDFLLTKSKSLKVEPGGFTDFKYQSLRHRILRINAELIPYKGRHTLFKQYPDLKPMLRDKLKKGHLLFRRMSQDNHIELIQYCNSLLAGKS